MKKTLLVMTMVSALAMSAMGVALAATIVTPDDTSWLEFDQRNDGASVISDDQPDAYGGEGSLRQSLTDGDDKTGFRTLQNFGPVDALSVLGFDWYRDGASEAPDHLTPAFEVYVGDGEGNSWLLKWEGVYNGYPSNGPAAPTDEWVTEDLIDANFWRIPQFVEGEWVGFGGCNEAGDPYECFQFDRNLTDEFLDGFDVVGLAVAVGSGWNGTYISYTDHITVNDTTFDFEPVSAPVDVILDGKDDCMDGGWETSTSPEFRNQGQCVSYFQANERAGK